MSFSEINNSKGENNSSFDIDKRAEVPKDSEIKPKDGGSYGEVKKNSDSSLYEVHHMPAKDISPLNHNDGPAIKMEKQDHRKTASYGSSKEAKEYRRQQKELIDKGDFEGAIQMDIDDIRSKFGDKYNKAIAQMLDYVKELKDGGII